MNSHGAGFRLLLSFYEGRHVEVYPKASRLIPSDKQDGVEELLLTRVNGVPTGYIVALLRGPAC